MFWLRVFYICAHVWTYWSPLPVELTCQTIHADVSHWPSLVLLSALFESIASDWTSHPGSLPCYSLHHVWSRSIESDSVLYLFLINYNSIYFLAIFFFLNGLHNWSTGEGCLIRPLPQPRYLHIGSMMPFTAFSTPWDGSYGILFGRNVLGSFSVAWTYILNGIENRVMDVSEKTESFQYEGFFHIL